MYFCTENRVANGGSEFKILMRILNSRKTFPRKCAVIAKTAMNEVLTIQ
jgi:hypothetical protein